MTSVYVSLRIPANLMAGIPTGPTRGGRSGYIRRAIAYFQATRRGELRIPIPREAELSTLQFIVRELNQIGVNLNQATMMLHLCEQGRDGRSGPPTEQEMRDLHRKLSSLSRRVEDVVRFWNLK